MQQGPSQESAGAPCSGCSSAFSAPVPSALCESSIREDCVNPAHFPVPNPGSLARRTCQVRALSFPTRRPEHGPSKALIPNCKKPELYWRGIHLPDPHTVGRPLNPAGRVSSSTERNCLAPARFPRPSSQGISVKGFPCFPSATSIPFISNQFSFTSSLPHSFETTGQ